MAMNNLHQCSGWTQWAECGVKISNHFGIRNRSRECIRETSENGKISEVETDLGLCEGVTNKTMCPNTYNLTTNGFCIKLQVTRKHHDDAEAECNEDGGHLININSDLKYSDVKTILSGFSVIDINIGGHRKSSTSPWEYKYGTNSGYFKWFSGYPRSESSRLCLALENLKWFNLSCRSKYPFLCEIP
ncbi:snaclec coagulation factor IX-binding protein subunit A-like [Ruditapes philippinarum]|uniref:snaclec coagulation factor IX-binding protein subunit A-like n=1 Tax=Ruditapes philippinarum TaxID=129788 RepID=UPI00295A5790|nr:snaclec coagulation factor IX-binding protein subunit A-like [Ruditapes philippinarum]